MGPTGKGLAGGPTRKGLAGGPAGKGSAEDFQPTYKTCNLSTRQIRRNMVSGESDYIRKVLDNGGRLRTQQNCKTLDIPTRRHFNPTYKTFNLPTGQKSDRN